MMRLGLDDVLQWYDKNDAVHGFSHIERVYHLCEHIGKIEGANLEIVLTAALLHDVASSDTNAEHRRNHHLYSAEFAENWLGEHGWQREDIAAVSHCIRAHRFRDENEMPQSLEAKVLFDADKLDSIGAVGVARAIAYAAQHGNPFYEQPSSQFLKDGGYAEGERHSAFHEYWFKLRNIRQRLLTATGMVMAEDRHKTMVDYFERLACENAGEL